MLHFLKAYQLFAHSFFLIFKFFSKYMLKKKIAFTDKKVMTFLWDLMSIFLHLSTKSKPWKG